MLKKIGIGLICIIILGSLIFGIRMFFVGKLQLNEVSIEINDISIEDCDSEYYDKMVGLLNFGLLEKHRYELINNYLDYKDICVYYSFENESETVTMNDIRLEPILPADLIDNVLFYNTGNGTYFINLEPNQKSRLTQHIIIKNDVLSNNSLQDLINEINVKLIYQAKGFKHNVIFKLQDGCIVSIN